MVETFQEYREKMAALGNALELVAFYQKKTAKATRRAAREAAKTARYAHAVLNYEKSTLVGLEL